MEEMTRASATPARGASLPPSERATPVQQPLAARSGSCGNLRACDFGEKIRQLEAIGNRLRGEVDVILQDNHNRHGVRVTAGVHDQVNARVFCPEGSCNSNPVMLRTMEDVDHAAFRELTDISNEQHAIEAMKSQLERLQHRLQESRPTSGLPPLPVSPAPRILRPRCDQLSSGGPMERELREGRERCGWLEAQLQECQQQLAMQADRHRGATEDLKARMYELQTEHEKMCHMREEEHQQHANLVEKLRDSLQELQDANRDQEHTLLETNAKLDATQQNHYVLESTLSQIRSVLQGVEQRRGRSFFDSDPVAKQSVSLLAHTLERYVQECEYELDSRLSKLHQTEQSLEDEKRAAQLHMEDLERTWKERLHAFSMEAEAKQAELRNTEAASRRRIEDADSQLRGLREALEEAGRRTADQSREAEQRLNAARVELENARSAWQEKRLGLEAALDLAQRDMASLRIDGEQCVSRAAELEGRLQGTKAQLTQAQAALEEIQRLRVEENTRLARVERQLIEMEKEVETKRAAALALERAMETLRDETALEITRIRSEGKLTYELQSRSVLEKLAKAEKEKEAAILQVETLRSEVKSAKRMLEDSAAADSMMKIRLEGATEEKIHLQGIIGNRSAEVERLTAERDFYFRCLNEKTEEVSHLKAEKQRLIVQLEDKIADMNSSHAERNGDLHQESEGMLGAKERQLEELITAREKLLRKLKSQEKAARDAENEKERLRAEMLSARSECEAVLRERSQLYNELRESRKEALQMANELDKTRTSGSDRELELQQKVQELTSRFRSIEQEVRAGKSKTPSSKDRAGGRILREMQGGGASKAQMEGVKTRLCELEGRASSVETERKRLKAENDRLCRLLERVTNQNEKLSGELEYYVNKAQDLREQMATVQADRERLALDFEQARQQVETLEEQTSKSKQQVLDLAQRLDALRRAPTGMMSNAGGPRAVSESHEMRTMLADVRTILSSHAHHSAGDQRSGSPVHTLLVDRSAQ